MVTLLASTATALRKMLNPRPITPLSPQSPKPACRKRGPTLAFSFIRFKVPGSGPGCKTSTLPASRVGGVAAEPPVIFPIWAPSKGRQMRIIPWATKGCKRCRRGPSEHSFQIRLQDQDLLDLRLRPVGERCRGVLRNHPVEGHPGRRTRGAEQARKGATRLGFRGVGCAACAHRWHRLSAGKPSNDTPP